MITIFMASKTGFLVLFSFLVRVLDTWRERGWVSGIGHIFRAGSTVMYAIQILSVLSCVVPTFLPPPGFRLVAFPIHFSNLVGLH